MPYNPENHGIAPHHAFASPGRFPDLGRVPRFPVTPVRRQRLYSSSGSKDLVKRPAAVGKVAPARAMLPRADTVLFLAVLAIRWPRRMSAPKGEGATQEVRRLVKLASPGRSPAGPTRQFDAKNEVHGCAAIGMRVGCAMRWRASASLYLQSPVLRDSSGSRCKDRLHAIT